MPINGYFDLAFAVGGTKTAVPDATQPSGAVSYETGYTPNYTYQPTQSGYLPVDEPSMNQLFYDITSAIQLQQQGLPAPFITSTMNGGSPFSYAAYAQVIYMGIGYISLVPANTDTPPSAKWQQINIAPNTFVGGVTTGSANAQVNATVSPAATSFTNGQSVVCTAGFTNTGSTTYSAGGETALIVKKNSGSGLINLVGGEIVATNTITFTKNLAVPCWVFSEGANLGTLAYLGISGNSGANDGSGNYAPAVFNQAGSTGSASKVYAEADWGNFIQRSDSGSAMTDTLPGSSGALPNGEAFFIKNVDATATNTVSVGAGGEINLGNSYSVASFIIQPGETYFVESAGGGTYNVNRVGSAVSGSPSVLGEFLNLKSKNTSTTQMNVTFDEATVATALGGSSSKIISKNLTLNTATTGAGGMDTGSPADSVALHIYLILNPTTNTAALLGTNAGTGATIYPGSNMPAGYTESCLVSSICMDAAGHFTNFHQNDGEFYVVQAEMYATGSTGVTSIAVPQYLPPNAIAWTGQLSYAANSSSGVCADANQTGAQGGALSGSSTSGNCPVSNVGITTASTVFYYSTGSSAGYLSGYKLW